MGWEIVRWQVAILSTGKVSSEYEDTSIQVIRELVEEELAGTVIEYRTVPLEMGEIMAALIEMTDYHHAELIFTLGGVGVGSSEVTPEATRQVIECEIPGLPELVRAQLRLKSSQYVWYRGITGVRGNTMIINLPNDPKCVHEMMAVMMNHLVEGLTVLRDGVGRNE